MMPSRVFSRLETFSQGFRRGAVLASLVAPVPAAAILAWHHFTAVPIMMVMLFLLALYAWRQGIA